MKLTTTKQRAVPVEVTPTDPRCMAIYNSMGNFEQFTAKWCPANLSHIANNVERSENVPSLVMLMRTYGTDRMVNNLLLFLVGVAKMLKLENVNFEDLATIARLITESPRLRVLNYAYIVTFFAKVAQGEYNIYSSKPHQVMKAFHEYAAHASRMQAIMKETAERKAEMQADAQTEKLSWEEFAAKRGIVDTNPIEDIIKNY